MQASKAGRVTVALETSPILACQGAQDMRAPRPRHARATPAPPKPKIAHSPRHARAMPAPRPRQSCGPRAWERWTGRWGDWEWGVGRLGGEWAVTRWGVEEWRSG
eukprot:gene19821-biopygen23514